MVQYRILLAVVVGAICLQTVASWEDNRTPSRNSEELYEFLEKTVENQLEYIRRMTVLLERSVEESLMLDEFELKELENVRRAFESLTERVYDKETMENFRKTVHTQESVKKMMEVAVERIVKSFLRVDHFRLLSDSTQSHLLNETMMDLLTIRGLAQLDEQNAAWTTTVLGDKTKVSLDMFDHLACPIQKARFLAFAKVIDPVLRKDETAMQLITLYTFFKSGRYHSEFPNVDILHLRFGTKLYEYLLERYTCATYGITCQKMLMTVPRALHRLQELNRSANDLFIQRQNLEQ